MRTYDEIMNDETIDLESDDTLFELAICMIEGRGCEKNIEKGIQYLKEAAGLGNPFAKEKMAEFTTCTEKRIETNIDYSKESVISLYHMASNHDLKAAIALASKVTEDMRNDVFQLFKEISDISHEDTEALVEIQYLLGEMYEDGCGNPQQINPEKSFICYANAWEFQFPKAASKLAYCYERGFGTKRNIIKARELRMQHGTIEDKYRLADCYYQGTQEEKSILNALKLFDEVAKSTEDSIYRTIANFRLLSLHEKSYMTQEAILNHLENAAVEGNLECLYLLAQAYLQGNMVEQDEDTGLFYLHQLFQQGDKAFVEAHRIGIDIFTIISNSRDEETFLHRIEQYQCEYNLFLQGVFRGFPTVTNRVLEEIELKDIEFVNDVKKMFTRKVKNPTIEYLNSEVAKHMVNDVQEAIETRLQREKDEVLKEKEQQRKQIEQEKIKGTIVGIVKNPVFLITVVYILIELVVIALEPILGKVIRSLFSVISIMYFILIILNAKKRH